MTYARTFRAYDKQRQDQWRRMYTKTKAPVTNKRKYGLATLDNVNTFPWTNHSNDVLQHSTTYYNVPHRTTTHHELPLPNLPCTTTPVPMSLPARTATTGTTR